MLRRDKAAREGRCLAGQAHELQLRQSVQAAPLLLGLLAPLRDEALAMDSAARLLT